MGLIDAENLMTVTDIREDGTEITYVPYSEIESAPTAYDVDAVVKQLEEYREEMEQFGCSGMLSDMIEIVKGGGLDAKTLTDIRHIGEEWKPKNAVACLMCLARILREKKITN